VRETITEYRNDLRNECPAYLVLRCDPPDLVVQIDDEEPRACGTAPIEVRPGTHRLSATARGGRLEQSVRVVGMEEHLVQLHLDAADAITLETGPSTAAILGVTGLAAGAVGLGVAVVLDVIVLGNKVDEFEASRRNGDGRALELEQELSSLRLATGITYIVGGAFVLAGGALFAVDVMSDDEGTVEVGAGPTGVFARGSF
jgi:hypothetical protein